MSPPGVLPLAAKIAGSPAVGDLTGWVHRPGMSTGDATARSILASHHTWAVVGCSPDPSRASNSVARFLRSRGYRVIPVNPQEEEVLGERCYPDLA